MPWFDLAMLFLVVFAAMMSPGPDMLLVARYSLGTHRGTVALCIAGITTGIGLHLTLALTGLAAIAATAPDALDVLRWLGALWLAWLVARWRATRLVWRRTRRRRCGKI